MNALPNADAIAIAELEAEIAASFAEMAAPGPTPSTLPVNSSAKDEPQKLPDWCRPGPPKPRKRQKGKRSGWRVDQVTDEWDYAPPNPKCAAELRDDDIKTLHLLAIRNGGHAGDRTRGIHGFDSTELDRAYMDNVLARHPEWKPWFELEEKERANSLDS